MLVSTHDMKLVEELFRRTIVMDEGMIVADGQTKEILADAKLLEAHGLEKPQIKSPSRKRDGLFVVTKL